MYTIYNLTTSSNVEIEDSCGPFQVLTHRQPLSASYEDAAQAYYASILRYRTRQLICQLAIEDVLVREGMMQWMVGDCEMVSGVDNVVSLMGKLLVGRMTGQNAISPRYSGTGTIALEPVEQEILLIDLADWPDGIILESNMFLACSSSVQQTVVSRKTVSTVLFGNEGLFSMCLRGDGYAAILSPCVKEQLIVVELEDDTMRIDGSFAIAWSASLSFTVENAGATTAASVLSSEGMTNTYRGTGRILLAPFAKESKKVQKNGKKTSGSGDESEDN